MEPIYIAGPTASGKSAVAMLLAERLGGEIISVDSMQVYRGLDIGTAKPAAEEQNRVSHHLINVADLHQTFDVAQFLRFAGEACREIVSRGRVPIYCGGTGLYFNALISGVGESPPADLALRIELESTPLTALLDELAKSDPETFARIDRSNPRRIIRAVEVIRSTRQPYSLQRASWQKSL
ncbi:MAG: tRNA (adenosine(37)-N6)-dimethylallyltransferase MiaA, partial [Limisphaerales bacterium]